MSSLQGHLLIASPRLLDPNFRRTVVLLVQHTEQGALGLILNRPTSVPIRQAWQQVSQLPCQVEEVLRLGGPVEGPLMALHTRPNLSESEVLPGVYFAVEPKHLTPLVTEPSGPARFYVGYAGWGAGQLESELSEGSWLTPEATPAHVFDNGEDLWERVTREIAATTVYSSLNIKHVPTDPSLN